jgi:superfamily II DNA helicase RecQ
VDEAQKVLNYGGSFRPIFNFLGEIRKRLPAKLRPHAAAAGAGAVGGYTRFIQL